MTEEFIPMSGSDPKQRLLFKFILTKSIFKEEILSMSSLAPDRGSSLLNSSDKFSIREGLMTMFGSVPNSNSYSLSCSFLSFLFFFFLFSFISFYLHVFLCNFFFV